MPYVQLDLGRMDWYWGILIASLTVPCCSYFVHFGNSLFELLVLTFLVAVSLVLDRVSASLFGA